MYLPPKALLNLPILAAAYLIVRSLFMALVVRPVKMFILDPLRRLKKKTAPPEEDEDEIIQEVVAKPRKSVSHAE